MAAPTNKSENSLNFDQKLKDAIQKRDMPTLRRLLKGGINPNAKFWVRKQSTIRSAIFSFEDK